MRRTTRLLIATALAGSLAPAALAQEATQGGQGNQSCAQLDQLTAQNKERFREDWVKEATRIMQGGDAAECARYVEAGQKAVRQLDARQASSSDSQSENQPGQDSEESRIVVTQPQPNVTVEQDAPEVTVNQAQPQVTVKQPQPEIIVRQAQPTVHVQIPQPTITIDQPQPEIIVRMPEPEVGVSMAEPEVEVSQQQPQVQVEQAQPQVQVELEQPEVAVQGNQQAQVQVERGKPVVRRTQPEGGAQVDVQQAQPKVTYQRAEPKVEFESAGEPKVQFNTSGEPKIRIERTQEQANAQAKDNRLNQQGQQNDQQANAQAENDRQRQQTEGEQTATASEDLQRVDPAQTASVDRDQELSQAARQRLGVFDPNQPAGEISAIQVSQLVDKNVVNRQGEEIGSVESVVTRNNRQYAVLSHGGVLGIGEREVALPLDRLSLAPQEPDRIILLGMTEEDLAELPEFDLESAQQLTPNQSVQIRKG